MPTYQTSSRVLAAVKRETIPGTANATVTGAIQMRIIDSPGLELKRQPVQSKEKRTDGLMTMGRLGYKTVDGGYNTELSVGGATDLVLESIMRSTWATSTSIGFATMTTVALGTNNIVAAGGSWYAQNVRIGDILTISGTSVAGDNNINARVLAMTTLTLTVPNGTYTTLTATATGTLTIAKKLITATTPTSYSHTIEEYDIDIDQSELFLGAHFITATLTFKPGAMAMLNYTVLAMDRTILASGSSPWFTSPSLTTGLGLIADDSTIYKNGVAVATFNSLELKFEITAKGEPVIGSLVTPAIFDNDCAVSGTIAGLRSDLSNLTLYDAETEFDLSILLQAPDGPPKSFVSFYVPRAKISALSAPFGGGDGAKVETLTLMIGPKTAATGYDGTIMSIHSSAP